MTMEPFNGVSKGESVKNQVQGSNTKPNNMCNFFVNLEHKIIWNQTSVLNAN